MLHVIDAIVECDNCCHPVDIELDINTGVPINKMLIGQFVCPECGTDNRLHIYSVCNFEHLYRDDNKFEQPNIGRQVID